MTVTVERFEPNPDHGRPKIVSFKGRAGTLAIHVERDSGTLWLYPTGPSGGDRGQVVFSPARAAAAAEWCMAPEELLVGVRGWIALRGGVLHVDGGARQRLHLQLDGESTTALLECVDAWAARARAVS